MTQNEIKAALATLTPEVFEELVRELLVVDGFFNIRLNAKGVDGGVDLAASKLIPMAHSQSRLTQWLIQAKHTSVDRALSLAQVDRTLAAFEANAEYQALLLVVNAKLTQQGVERIRRLSAERYRPICCWDITDIAELLRRNPYVMDVFFQRAEPTVIEGASRIRILIISDSSPFAYSARVQLSEMGFNVKETSIHRFGSNQMQALPADLWQSFDVCIAFLGEAYWKPVSLQLINGLRNSMHNGLRVIFTPFFSWSVASSLNKELLDILPVRAENRMVSYVGTESQALQLEHIGDRPLGEILQFQYEDSFVENRRFEVELPNGEIFSPSRKLSGSATYEFFRTKPHSKTILSYSDGNPFLVSQPISRGLSIYLNICGHNCLSASPMPNPLDNTPDMAAMLGQLVLWAGSRDSRSSPH